MSVLGFIRSSTIDTAEAAMVLPFDPDEEEEALLKAGRPTSSSQPSSSSAAALQEAWDWLRTQLDTALEMKPSVSNTGCCAECVLQLRLPNTGTAVKVGFEASINNYPFSTLKTILIDVSCCL